MYRVHVQRHFDAAHCLRGYKGRCENLHGHRWQVIVCVEAETLDETGLAFDFTALKGALDDVLDAFDHHDLGETPPFDQINPSSENIARVIYGRMQDRLGSANLCSVQVYESPDAWVTYTKE